MIAKKKSTTLAKASKARNLVAKTSAPCKSRAAPVTPDEAEKPPIRMRGMVPGTWVDETGAVVDENGVRIAFKTLRQMDSDRWEGNLGAPITQPADFLKSVALDPTLSLSMRVEAASKAAPYFSAKRVAIQGVEGAPPIALAALSAMPQTELDRLEHLLTQAQALLDKAGGAE